VLFKLTVTEK